MNEGEDSEDEEVSGTPDVPDATQSGTRSGMKMMGTKARKAKAATKHKKQGAKHTQQGGNVKVTFEGPRGVVENMVNGHIPKGGMKMKKNKQNVIIKGVTPAKKDEHSKRFHLRIEVLVRGAHKEWLTAQIARYETLIEELKKMSDYNTFCTARDAALMLARGKKIDIYKKYINDAYTSLTTNKKTKSALKAEKALAKMKKSYEKQQKKDTKPGRTMEPDAWDALKLLLARLYTVEKQQLENKEAEMSVKAELKQWRKDHGNTKDMDTAADAES